MANGTTRVKNLIPRMDALDFGSDFFDNTGTVKPEYLVGSWYTIVVVGVIIICAGSNLCVDRANRAGVYPMILQIPSVSLLLDENGFLVPDEDIFALRFSRLRYSPTDQFIDAAVSLHNDGIHLFHSKPRRPGCLQLLVQQED
jgi:hypothetical protein